MIDPFLVQKEKKTFEIILPLASVDTIGTPFHNNDYLFK